MTSTLRLKVIDKRNYTGSMGMSFFNHALTKTRR